MLLHLFPSNYVSFHQFLFYFQTKRLKNISCIFEQKLSIGGGRHLYCIELFSFSSKHFCNLQILSNKNQSNFLCFNRSILHNKHFLCIHFFNEWNCYLWRSPIGVVWLCHVQLWRKHVPQHSNGHSNIDQLRASKSYHKCHFGQIQFKSLHSPGNVNCWFDWLLDFNVLRPDRIQIRPNPSHTKLDRNRQCLHCCKSYFPWFSWTYFCFLPIGHPWCHHHPKLLVSYCNLKRFSSTFVTYFKANLEKGFKKNMLSKQRLAWVKRSSKFGWLSSCHLQCWNSTFSKCHFQF